jgi:hypothetical protein
VLEAEHESMHGNCCLHLEVVIAFRGLSVVLKMRNDAAHRYR